ncbi:uncharacterized protein LOC126750277 [Anthonomus grandis grandis]|uniref:uncharacterized protein LOC126750277 n=1 Tax=Anthonomus grandis grandis TaxID=2921223 RepID=UPI002166A3A4|nr:uncharacterized protein LOC126750277 [Anthonomus grandis grandis]
MGRFFNAQVTLLVLVAVIQLGALLQLDPKFASGLDPDKMKACMQEADITMQEIAGRKFSPKVECMAKCVLKECGITKADGSFDVEKAKELWSTFLTISPEMEECLVKMRPITTCPDIAQLHTCIPDKM